MARGVGGVNVAGIGAASVAGRRLAAFGGAPVKLGALDVSGAFPAGVAVDPGAVAQSLAREGCVGETVAAVELASAAQHAASTAERRALLRLHADEVRHAAERGRGRRRRDALPARGRHRPLPGASTALTWFTNESISDS